MATSVDCKSTTLSGNTGGSTPPLTTISPAHNQGDTVNNENQCCERGKCIGNNEPASETVGLSSPWYIYYREVKALFHKDPAVTVQFEDYGDSKTLKLFVEGEDKAEAIGLLLPKEKVFGNVVVKIQVIPSNKLGMTTEDIIKCAFEGNPSFKGVATFKPEGTTIPFTFVTFENAVTQMWIDNLSDINGLKSTLLEDIARDVLETPSGVYYCTAPGDDVIRK